MLDEFCAAGKTGAITGGSVLDISKLASSAFGKVKGMIAKDEEEKALLKRIGLMTLPAFIELFLSSLFNLVDVVMVGKLSPEAISGVGLTNQPFFLLITIFSAINVGTTTLVAWAVGEGNKKRSGLIARQALIFNLVIGIVLTFAGYYFSEPIMRFMTSQAAANAKTPEQIASYRLMLGYATEYFKIISMSVVFSALTLAVSAALRGCGQTKLPMFYNLAANGINVIFNFLLIYGHLGFPKMGVAGAATATSISRVLACLFALGVLFFYKNCEVRIRIRDSWKPNFALIGDIFSIGMPSAGEQFVIQGGLTVYTRILSGLGSIAFAAHQIVSSVNSMTFSISQAFSISGTALVGQAMGADDCVLAEKITLVTRRLARITTFVVAVIIAGLGYYIALLFLDPNQASSFDVARTAAPVFVIAAMVQYVQSSQMSTAAALRGSGDTMYPLYSSFFGILVCRLFLAYLFVIVFKWGILGGWSAFLFDQCVRSFVIKRRFNTGKWKTMKAVKEEKSRKRREKYGS